MHFMDVDASGEIDFDEFCMGVMDEKALLTPAKLQVAFNYFDKNDDGRIDVGMGLAPSTTLRRAMNSICC